MADGCKKTYKMRVLIVISWWICIWRWWTFWSHGVTLLIGYSTTWVYLPSWMFYSV